MPQYLRIPRQKLEPTINTTLVFSGGSRRKVLGGGGGVEMSICLSVCLSVCLSMPQYLRIPRQKLEPTINTTLVFSGGSRRKGGGVRLREMSVYASISPDSSAETGTHNQYDASVQWGK